MAVKQRVALMQYLMHRIHSNLECGFDVILSTERAVLLDVDSKNKRDPSGGSSIGGNTASNH